MNKTTKIILQALSYIISLLHAELRNDQILWKTHDSKSLSMPVRCCSL